MQLVLNHIVKRSEDIRSFKDRRYKVIRIIASYIGDDLQEYRKSFESHSEPIVPDFGTHTELNNLKIQYK